MLYQLNIRELTYALSQAVDYVGIDDTKHGKRVAYIACEIAKKLGWRQSKLDKLMMMAMLHDCGVSSNEIHDSLINHLDWEYAYIHCEKGATLLKSIPIYADFAEVIALHHTHWEAFSPTIDEDVKLFANLIYLSDRIDALYAQFGAHYDYEQAYIRSIIQKNTPTTFSPKLTQAFEEISRNDSFWYYLEPDYIHHYFHDWIENGEIETIHFDLLKSIACMFAGIVDAKEDEASHNALEVATLAHALAKACDLPLREQEQIELAALLQDLGKLRIPDVLITKTTPLNDQETIKIKRHRFDTQIILRQIKGFESIAHIVTLHHNNLSTQELLHYNNTELSLEATIVSIATLFQAFFQHHEPNNMISHHARDFIQEMPKVYHLRADTLNTIATYLKNYCDQTLHGQ